MKVGIPVAKQYKKIDYNLARAKEHLRQMYPDEVHNAGGDCINPKCDYSFTDGDRNDIDYNYGYFSCPKCGNEHNYMDYGQEPGGWTHSGLSLDQMGRIGEKVVGRLGSVPNVGQINQTFDDKHHPVDAHIGPYAVEIKTNHSEAQPRFKISGKAQVRQDKIDYANEKQMKPGLMGVRLNFYNNNADLYFRPAYTDTWIGNPSLQHIGTYDFSDLNPYKHPEDVPPADQMPDDDDLGIPKASWWTGGPTRANEAYNNEHGDRYWGFRWGYYQGRMLFSDEDWGDLIHLDMLERFRLDTDEDLDLLGKDVWIGYGTLDTTTGNVIVESASMDYGHFDSPPPIILEEIKERLMTKGFSVKAVQFGSLSDI